MTIGTILATMARAARAGAALLLRAGATLFRSARGKRRAAGPEIQPEIQLEIVDALSVYLGGNRDSGRLRALAAAHPDEVRETILQYQTIVAGRREELCALTLELGYVDRWHQEAHSGDVMKRRKAFSCISAVAHYEPVRRVVGTFLANALRDTDEQIRLEVARFRLSTGEPAEIARVFEDVLTDTPGVRLTIAGELGRYATQLCEAAVPQALRSQNPRDVLKLLVSWERALPLLDVQPLAEHADPAVRVEVMRLLPFLPTTPENRAAVLSGLADEDHDVRAAATDAAGRLRLPNPDSMASRAPDGGLELVHSGGGENNTFRELENA